MVTYSPRLSKYNADSVAVEFRVNDQPVWEDEISPQHRRQPVRDGKDLFIRFGMDNINFSGNHRGCDKMSAVLSFWKDGKPTGEKVILVRPYGALRNIEHFKGPGAYNNEIEQGKFKWSAKYHPLPYGEKEVFLGGDIFNLDAGSKQRSSEDSFYARQLEARDAFNALGWSVSRQDLGWGSSENLEDALPLVAILRPPKNQRDTENGRWYGTGRAMGVKLETGQVRFTFRDEEMRIIAGTLLKQAKSDYNSKEPLTSSKNRGQAVHYSVTMKKNVDILKANENDLYIYSLKDPSESSQDKWVCNRAVDLK